MLDNPAMTWAFTALLLLSGSYHVVQAARSRHLTVQANQGLHALMNILMAALLWNLIQATMLAQIALLAGAALWFVVQAVARPEFKILCVGSHSRLKCIYHSITMAGAAAMVAMMGTGHLANDQSLPADAISTPPAHHHMSESPHLPLAQGLEPSVALTGLLAVFFATAAVIFFVLLLGNPLAKRTRTAAPRSPARMEHGVEATGATIMALMFATMAA